MESRFSPDNIEPRWHDTWKEKKSFAPSGKGEPYSIVIPPPNVTGALHLGHALNNTIQDVLVRWQRKMGKNTLWIPGTDHAGIATQAVVEKRLKEDEDKTRHDLGREALVERIWDWKHEYEARITNQLKMIGSSCDWDRQRFTLDPVCAKAVRHTFFNLFKKELIYRGKRLVNWDAHLQTAVADDEIYYETLMGHLWTFKYDLADGSGHLEVATTRPETILGDTAVAVHPNDERYKHLIGKMCKVPFVDREIPIIADGLLVNPEFGTGVVKVTPGHDPNDYATGLRHKLPIVNIMNADGSINENGGEFEGLDRLEARQKIVESWKATGHLVSEDEHEHPVGHSDRSKTPIEPWMSDQWFVKMDDLAERAMDAVRNKEVQFFPERYERSYLDWLGEKRDWCISRQLWWGHRIPIWSAEGLTEELLQEHLSDREDICWIHGEDDRLLVCALDDIDENIIPGITLVQDPDVLDTWFSSALWPHSTLGWPEKTDELDTFYPTSTLVTSRDIITLWVARMVIFGQENMGQIPFSKVYIHTKILDGQGQTMSKSKGNGVDPLDIIAKYGTDALRFTMASMCTDNQDARMPVKEEKLEDGRVINTSEKFEIGRNFANKLWNACRFVQPHLKAGAEYQIDESLLALEDRWILSRINSTIASINESLENFKLAEMVQTLYHFTWDDFCSRYLEIKKSTLTADEDSAEKQNGLAVFISVLESLLGILHPVMPFITEELNAILFPETEMLIEKSWPALEEKWIQADIEASFSGIFNVVEAVRSIRGQYSISPSRGLDCTVNFDTEVAQKSLQENADIVTNMAKLSTLTVQCQGEVPKFSGRKVFPGGEVAVSLEGILDREKEIAKIEKELSKTKSFLIGLEKKLSNERFVNNAPANVVAHEREKLQNQQEIAVKLKAALADLK